MLREVRPLIQKVAIMTAPHQSARRDSPRGAPRFSRTFNRFWAGNMAAGLGDGLLMTALPLLAAMFTNDPLLIAGLMVAKSLPWLLMGLPVGVIVDRVDRGTVVTCANVVRVAAVAALAFLVATGQASIWTLYIVMFVVMTCDLFFEVATQTMVLGLAPRGGLDRANARLTGGRTLMEDFSGAPLSGLLFAVAAVLPLAVNAGVYALSVVILLGLPLAVRKPKRSQDDSADGEQDKSSALKDLKEGMQFVLRDRLLCIVVVISTVMRMAMAAQAAVLVLLVLHHFEVPETLYGAFMATAAVGAVAGVLLTGRLVDRIGRYGVVAFAFTGMGLSCLLLGLSPNAYAAALAWAALGLAATVSGTVTVGAAQLIVPGYIMGRVMSVVRMVSFGLAPVGALIGGVIAGWDLRLPSVVAGLSLLTVFLFTWRTIRAMLERADGAESEMVDEHGRDQDDRGEATTGTRGHDD